MTPRQALRRWVPFEARLAFRVARRRVSDRIAGVRFATARGDTRGFPFVVTSYGRPFIDYPGQERLGRAKRKNQALLAAALTGIVIEPGQTFAVWNLARRPSSSIGYEHAAALKAGELTTDIGGAICLLSTVLYNVGLLGGLRITERHCHSVDSYGERRYFELGRDAAIEYGYRDLRFMNTYSVPVLLEIEVTDERVAATLRAPSPLQVEVHLLVDEPELLAPPPRVVTIDRSLTPGAEVVVTPPLPGLRVRTYRAISYEDGGRTTEDLGETVHVPRPAVVRRGPPRVA
ncbi:MAG: VanW family protein [Tepidiformaceae bacterium]